jgi:hypothetical protein
MIEIRTNDLYFIKRDLKSIEVPLGDNETYS